MVTKKEFTKRLAKKVQETRRKKNMSQEELADRAELYRTYVGHIENGRYSPSGYVLYKLIRALGVNPKELLEI